MTTQKFVFIFFGLNLILLSACRMNKTGVDTPSSRNTKNETIVEVAQNERGVLFRRFANGIDNSRVYLSGKYRVMSFDRFIKYNIDSRTVENYFESETISGKKIILHLQYSFKIVPEKIALMEYYIGHNYSEIIVEARIQTSVDKYMVLSQIEWVSYI